jgi:DtxR family Mn-dependent transcriptional regulator
MYSLAEENYLKTIFHLEKEYEGGVTTNAIAVKMDTKPSSVTQLTETGKKIAANVIRKHRLWEVFLVEKLNFHWDEVHEIAEQLEHVKSDELIIRLDKFLDFPDFDPHGDPIPDKDGNIKPTEKKLLSELDKNQRGICVGVKESSSEFLQYLDKRKIGIGSKVEVLGKEFFDGSMMIQVGKDQLFISKVIADNIFLKTN